MRREAKQARTTSRTIERGQRSEIDDVPNDAVSALAAVLRDCHVESFPTRVPLALIHQLGDILRSRSEADEGLDLARRMGQVRFLKTWTSRDADVLVVRESDYVGLVRGMISSSAAAADPMERRALRNFLRLLPREREFAVTRTLLGDETSQRVLARLGLVVHKNDHEFFFSLPSIGSLCREIDRARGALIKMVVRGWAGTRNEIARSRLPSTLKGTSLPVTWVVRDAVGTGLLKTRDSALEGPRAMLCYRPSTT